MSMSTSLVPGLVAVGIFYTIYRAAEPFLAIRRHLKEARAVGLPVKILPVPQGLFSFFAFQLATKLRLVQPGSWLHRVLNAGRPEGHDAHKGLGDVFLTVNPMGVGLVVADPALVSYVSSRREQFPKPPNTGAVINVYGRNVINARGETWKLHRRVTGPVFSERIHARVWDEAARQVTLMRESWGSSGKLADPGRDALRLGLNVITGAAYGCQLAWEGSPPSALNSKQEGGRIPFAEAVESFTAHLMPYFLTPKWWLRLAPADSAAGRARTAYAAFGGYMRGMLAAERERMDEGQPSENLLTALLDAQEHEDKEGRRLPDEEVLGNAFIFLFAGHETTANTLHYSLLQLAAHPIAQEQVLAEIDAMRSVAAAEGRPLAYEDFGRARWLMAVMNETLRMYTPTSMVHKWTDAPAPITVGGQAYVLPAQTRISINCTGVHANPAVWGVDADTWKPERWIVPAGSNLSVSIASTPVGTPLPTPMLPEIVVERSTSVALARKKMAMLPTPPATPVMSFFAAQASSPTESTSTISRRDSASSESSTFSSSSSSMSLSPKSSLKPTLMPSSFTTSLPTWNMPFGSITPPDTPLLASSASNAVPSPPSSPTPTQIPLLQTPSVVPASSTRQASAHWDTIDVLRPAKGTFLPFSEGSRACSGRKFAAVEFVSALCALLSDQQVTLDESAGWTSERLEKSLRGRKAGALTLQPPEVVPLVFTPREAKV